MLACGFQNGGLRVFDIRDPSHAKEIAYWKPGAVRTRVLPASGSWATGVDRTVDKIAHWQRWLKAKQNDNGDGNSQGENGNGQGNGNNNGQGDENGNGAELQLWTVSDGHGFQVLRFTDNFKKNNRDLFEDSDD